MAASAPPSVLVLLCGLPAAGKTTLARRFTAAGSSSTRRFDRISFDDLYYASSTSKTGILPVDFDPERWKSCQKEMARRVRRCVEQQRTAAGTTDKAIAEDERQQLVLLIDDNFQYRSLRKRFFQLAADLNCGFAILYVNIPAPLCRERNAARCAQGEESARVPDEVFQRMASVFEPPDGRQNPWERNTHELRPDGATNEDAKVQEAMDILINQAARELTERRFRLEETQRKTTLQVSRERF
ncbi:hypothetical protein BBJ28_00009527 [Nothophytophthora sp. Chile5]|nr:hypothetical protein BBJ28_00009527 [Nothophytophthora sp. Chile5]